MAKLVNLYLDGKFPVSTNRLNHFDRLFGQALFGGVEKSVDYAPIISINDALNKPALELLCKITAIQEGSGDPSPTNIRNFVGFSGLSLFRAGKNLIDISTLATANITYSDGVLTGTASAFASAYTSGIPFDCSELRGAQIVISAEAKVNVSSTSTTSGLIIRVVYTDGTSDSINWKNNDTEYTKMFIVSNENKTIDCIRMTYASGGSNIWNVRNLQIEVGQNETAYAPYIIPSEISVSWLSEAGIVYGGILNLITGLLAVTYIAETYNGGESEDWNAISNSKGYYLHFDRARTEIDGTKELIANSLVGMLAGGSASVANNRIRLNLSLVNLLCMVDVSNDFPTLSDWKTFIGNNPLVVLYPLSEPITYQLSPSEVVLLAGNNTLWNTAGDTALTYMAKR